ncbi:hypothetical protein, partial [Streptococcus pneumoniae]|uniref:hypothetical protein n=1 Tax=Streptococcus pneumoniae TaxID=1313 RepID=UPI001E4DF35B
LQQINAALASLGSSILDTNTVGNLNVPFAASDRAVLASGAMVYSQPVKGWWRANLRNFVKTWSGTFGNSTPAAPSVSATTGSGIAAATYT